MATGLGRGVITAVLLGTLLAGGCTGSTTTPSITPSPSSATPTPTPTPSRTYGPNQTAALAAVTGYYTWWNTARKEPRDPRFGDLTKFMPASAYVKITPNPIRDISDLASYGNRQVGDMAVTDAAPETENKATVTVTLCLDRTGTSIVDAAGATVNPKDSQTGATVPAAQVFTRRAYVAVTEPNPDGGWWITAVTGGTSSC